MQTTKQHVLQRLPPTDSASELNAAEETLPESPRSRPRSYEFYESMVWSMVIGAVRFPVIRLPRMFVDWLSDTPTPVARVGRLSVMLMCLLAIIFGPLIYARQFTVVNDLLRDRGCRHLVSWVEASGGVVKGVCFSWGVLACYGAVRAARFFAIRARELQDDPYTNY
jgi:hypothetical protein